MKNRKENKALHLFLSRIYYNLCFIGVSLVFLLYDFIYPFVYVSRVFGCIMLLCSIVLMIRVSVEYWKQHKDS